MAESKQEVSTGLTHLFDLGLEYEQDSIECAPIGQTEGALVGGGTGAIEGPRIKGAVRWSNDEHTLKDGLCSLQLPGTITTDDGGELRSEARGLAHHVGTPAPAHWRVAGAIQFETDDPGYEWLTQDTPAWVGEFDMGTLKARYSVFSSDH